MTQTSTQNFPTDVVLTVATGKGLCDNIAAVQNLAEFLTGDPVMTHEFASRELFDTLRYELVRQHPQLAGAIENVPNFTQTPKPQREAVCRAWTAQVATVLGDTLIIQAPDPRMTSV